MPKVFNVTGVCVPWKHYMVNIDDKLAQIKTLIDKGAYFTINRARQYGKTTTLNALAAYLNHDYLTITIDFQEFSNMSFRDENTFSSEFASSFLDTLDTENDFPDGNENPAIKRLVEIATRPDTELSLRRLFKILNLVCSASQKPIVLMIDEADSAQNNQVFLDFLAQLRNYYLKREKTGFSTFQSVILAGVYDVKNLQSKIRTEGEHKQNSPWNIAAEFDINMSFSKSGIAGMLNEYETDWHTGMDADEIAGLIYDDTSGYPFLVSRLCMLLDEKVCRTDGKLRKNSWSREDFFAAERMLLSEKNTLFESLTAKLKDYPKLNKMLYSLLFTGKNILYNPDNPHIDMATMFGFVRNSNGILAISNRIFETRLYNLYLSTDDMQTTDLYKASLLDKNQFVTNGTLNMRLILEKFTEHFHDLYGDSRDTFIEDEGRKFFLLYLRPIINGTGNYYVEARTRELKRTDVIVDYRGKQYVIELKIWHGNEYNSRGEQQLVDYLNAYHIDTGYMISFNFNKKKRTGVHDIILNGKTLVEAVI